MPVEDTKQPGGAASEAQPVGGPFLFCPNCGNREPIKDGQLFVPKWTCSGCFQTYDTKQRAFNLASEAPVRTGWYIWQLSDHREVVRLERQDGELRMYRVASSWNPPVAEIGGRLVGPLDLEAVERAFQNERR